MIIVYFFHNLVKKGIYTYDLIISYVKNTVRTEKIDAFKVFLHSSHSTSANGLDFLSFIQNPYVNGKHVSTLEQGN